MHDKWYLIKREVIKDKYDSYILIPEQKETVINHVGNSNLRYKNNVTIDNLEKWELFIAHS